MNPFSKARNAVTSCDCPNCRAVRQAVDTGDPVRIFHQGVQVAVVVDNGRWRRMRDTIKAGES